ncbi:hypothetical protein AA313_de0206702 [Arthrobotrys entomopaga]|nr:hypothetical protein AA313_de0206702 [Arthrobotrys entomopaga]
MSKAKYVVVCDFPNWLYELVVALIGIFFVGSFAVIASISRIWALWLYQNTKDVSYDAIFILLFSNIEINLAIITACAPALWPLSKEVFKPSMYGRSYEYQNQSDNNRNNSKQNANDYPLSSLDTITDNKRQTKVRGGKGTHNRNESEEEIIQSPNGIVQTREISISVNKQHINESFGVAQPSYSNTYTL